MPGVRWVLLALLGMVLGAVVVVTPAFADTATPTPSAAPTTSAAPTPTAAPTTSAAPTDTAAPTTSAAPTTTAAPIDTAAPIGSEANPMVVTLPTEWWAVLLLIGGLLVALGAAALVSGWGS